ncbi:MAG: acetyl-CoA carboxylase biotin carboxyl carrier protein subunit [Anaerolineales bacterium]
MKYVTTIGDKEYSVEILDKGHISINDKIVEVDFRSIGGQPVYSLLIDGKSYEAFIDMEEDEWQVLLLGQQYPVKVEDAREKRLKEAAGGKLQGSGEFQLKAPMPGLVAAIPVEENQQIEKGQVLLVLESMKMQNELRAPRAGKVERIKVKTGESVEQRQVLLTVS